MKIDIDDPDTRDLAKGVFVQEIGEDSTRRDVAMAKSIDTNTGVVEFYERGPDGKIVCGEWVERSGGGVERPGPLLKSRRLERFAVVDVETGKDLPV